MPDEPVVVSRPFPGVAEVRLNRPDKLNALTPAVFRALAAAGQSLAAEADLRAVVLCGAGRAFCAGLDLASFGGADDSITTGSLAARTHGAANLFQAAAWVWRTLPVPVIAALTGVAYGGGLQIALGADIRMARADTRLSVMEINWGLVPDMAGMVLMQKLVREDILRDLCLTGRVVSGVEAKEFGLVTALHEDPHTAAMEKAREVAAKSPAAVRAAKRLLNLASSAPPESVLMAESYEQAALIGSAEQRETVRARLEGRAADYAPKG
jgi:enoyl-CoA hydratase/carnithine racemase